MKRIIGLTIAFLSLVSIVIFLAPNREEVREAQSARESKRSDQQVADSNEIENKSQPHVSQQGEDPFSENANEDLLNSTSSSYKKTDESSGRSSQTVRNTSPGLRGRSDPEAWKNAPALSKTEIASVQKFINLAFRFAKPTEKPSALLNELAALKLAPVATQDFNDHTGKMVIIRTNETLEGARYFHAQFFEDENKRTYLQHLSFEIRPSPDAMDRAVKMVEEKLGAKVVPLQAPNSHYALYKAPNDYIVWVKRLEYDDLKDDPFNARDPESDVGTLRVAIEKDIHAHENE